MACEVWLNTSEPLRNAVLFLAVLPTLMPPGMCLCKLVPVTTVAAPATSWKATAPHDAAAGRKCRCDSCHTKALSPSHEAETIAPPSPAATPDSQQSTPSERQPCCPAAVGSVPLVTVLPPAAVHISVDATVCVVLRADELAASDGYSVTPVATYPTRPLIITHCTLLI